MPPIETKLRGLTFGFRTSGISFRLFPLDQPTKEVDRRLNPFGVSEMKTQDRTSRYLVCNVDFRHDLPLSNWHAGVHSVRLELSYRVVLESILRRIIGAFIVRLGDR